MTNGRNIQDHATGSDELVTRAYRDLATERAPEELNAAVLRKAAQAARPPYLRSVLWTRPAAWAAVVAICLAITLQVTEVPTPDDLPTVRQLKESDALDEARNKMEQTQNRERQVAGELSADGSAGDSNTAEQFVPGGRSVATASVPDSQAQAVLEEAAPALAEDFEMPDADMLRRAEERVRLQAGDNRNREENEVAPDERADAAAAASGFAAASAPARLYVPGCTEVARQNPDDWLDCIRSLEDAGRVDEAALQREQLAEAFPDFEIPARTE